MQNIVILRCSRVDGPFSFKVKVTLTDISSNKIGISQLEDRSVVGAAEGWRNSLTRKDYHPYFEATSEGSRSTYVWRCRIKSGLGARNAIRLFRIGNKIKFIVVLLLVVLVSGAPRLPCRAVPCRVGCPASTVSCRAVPCRVPRVYRVVPCRVPRVCRVVSCRAVSGAPRLPCRVVPCRVGCPASAVSCRAVPCRVPRVCRR